METKPSTTSKIIKNLWLIVIFIMIIILYTNNPTDSQFKEFLKSDFKEQARSEGIGILGGPIAILAGTTTVRKDYVLFSTYEITILGYKYKYLGLLNHFYEINNE